MQRILTSSLRALAPASRKQLQSGLTGARRFYVTNNSDETDKLNRFANRFAYRSEDGSKIPMLYFTKGKEHIDRAEPYTMPEQTVIMIQEWWGVNEQFKRHVFEMTQRGFHVYVPDLWDGKVALDVLEAQHMYNALDWSNAVKDMQCIVNQIMKEQPSGIGVMGFCMGGGLAMASAAHVHGIDAAVSVYGLPPPEVDIKHINIPVQMHFGDKDAFYTPEMVNKFEENLIDYEGDYEIWRYPDATHAFMNTHPTENDARLQKELGFVPNPTHSAVVWDRINQFFFHSLPDGNLYTSDEERYNGQVGMT